MRLLGIATSIAAIGILTAAATSEVSAQAARQITAPAAADNRISADSPPYRIEWNGNSGVFIRKPFGQEPEIRQPMNYLHTDAGPVGFAKHLVWFLARDTQGFSVLWCYLNDSGREFDCWLYRFPSNQLTSLHFTGPYQFGPPSEPALAAPMNDLNLGTIPRYAGPDFTYRDWTRIVGALPQLDLQPTRLPGTAATGPQPATPAAGAPAKTLTQISVFPLHQVEVGSANGWREGGWHELHALAFDSAKDPYYLILYSNTPRGYAVDLKRAQIYTADFGSKVVFPDGPEFGPNDNPLNTEPEIKVRRYDRHEIVLTTRENLANPYLDAQVGIEFTGPNAKPVVIPGFWDGGGTFRVRFTPTLPGRWTWRSLSKISDLSGQTGAFLCLNEEAGVKGFVNVQSDRRDTHHFSYSNGDPFLPALLWEPTPTYAAMSSPSKTAGVTGSAVKLAGLPGAEPAQNDTASFVAYQRFVSAAAAKGFNRLVGGNLLGSAAGKLVRANEGGAAFDGADLDRINPAFFQWMDRRIAYCNARGIVPDVGIGTLEDALFTAYKPEALFRFWAYVVARYSSYDVNWNLFQPADSAASEPSRKIAEQFAELTRLYDPNHHPITVVLPGGTAAPAPAAPAPAVPTLDSGGQPLQGGTGPGRRGRFGRQGAPGSDARRPGEAGAVPAPPRTSGGAMSGAVKTPVQAVPNDLPWEDVITILGGDVNALPWYTWITKPLVMLERPTPGKEGAMTPDVTRHRMWEARMRGAYWAPGNVPTLDVSSLSAPEIQWAAYCADLFRRTRFQRLSPRPEMLGGPTESAADRRRRKKAEASAAKANPPPTEAPEDFDPFDPDAFGDLPPVPPAPKPPPMFVMADPAREYLVYFEQGGTILLDLLEATGKVQVTWFNPRTGEYSPAKQILGGAYVSFSAPDANDWVLYVSRL